MQWRMMRPGVAILVAIVVAVAGLRPVPEAAAGRVQYYLSLGDSLAAGVQPDASGRNAPTDEGYADQLFTAVRDRFPGLRLVKLGCPGESTATMRRGGGIRSYPNGAQLDEAVAFLEANRAAVAFVTIDIGANELTRCAPGGTIDQDCVAAAFRSVSENLPAILTALRAAAGPSVPIYGMTFYNPFLGWWLLGTAGQVQARSAAELGASFNRTLAQAYASAGVAVADVAAAFDSDEFDTFVPLPDGRMVPLNGARICAWTWVCVPPPVGPNVHANAAGYGAIAREFAGLIP